MIHQLRTEFTFFDDVVSGKKPFEIRENDRNFMVGDFLALNQLTKEPVDEDGNYGYTGRCCLLEVSYVLDDERFLADGYVAMGTKPCAIAKLSERMFMNRDKELFEVPVYENHVIDRTST